MTNAVTILLLDDEPLLRDATALLLSRRGARVTVAASADEAVSFAQERLFDVAVFDVSRPGPSIGEILRRIQARALPPKRVIVVGAEPGADVSGSSPELGGPHAGDAGAGGITRLPRPYPFDSLLRAVFGASGRRRTRSGVFRTIGGGASKAQPGPRGAARAHGRRAR